MDPEPNTESMAKENNPTDESFDMDFINPFLVKVIIDNLFKFLNEKDLLNNRLVHSEWNASAVSRLKKIGGSICFAPRMKTTLRTYGINDMANFINLRAKSPKFPFVNILLSADIIRSAEDVATWFDFVKETSQTIQRLAIINKRKIANNKEFAEFLEQDFSFPNLRELVVDQKERTSSLPHFCKFVSIIVAKSPALKKIKFGNEFCLKDKAINSLIENLQLHHANLRKINDLGLTGSFNRHHFIAMSKLGLALKTFELRISKPLAELPLITFLQSQSSTLENLSIGYYSFSNLMILENTSAVFYKNFLPKLQALTISMELLSKLLSYTEPLENVKDLKLPPEITHRKIPQIMSRFPNLQKLTIPDDPKIIDQVVSTMEDLNELSLYPKCGVIGLNISQDNSPANSLDYMVPIMEFRTYGECQVDKSLIRDARNIPSSSTQNSVKILKIFTLVDCPSMFKLPNGFTRISCSIEQYVEHLHIPGYGHVLMQMWSG